MNAVFAPDREPDERKPRPHSEPAPLDELKSILAAKPQPFRIQFLGAASGRGLSVLGEVEIQASDVSAAIVAAANLAFPPKTIACASWTAKARLFLSGTSPIADRWPFAGSNVPPINGTAPAYAARIMPASLAPSGTGDACQCEPERKRGRQRPLKADPHLHRSAIGRNASTSVAVVEPRRSPGEAVGISISRVNLAVTFAAYVCAS